MPQRPTTERLTAGEKRLAEVIGTQAAAMPLRNGETTPLRPQVDLVWDADPDRLGSGD